MTKQALQKELLEKVKPGTKPSQLKRSKSASDLPTQTKNNSPKRKSLEVLPTSPSLKAQLTQAQDQISILELKLETQARELTELNSLSAENEHLKAQSKVKQQEVEQLRKDLEALATELSQVKAELDKSLEARHQGLKD
jgi:chromosome segregation ATPase